MNKQLLHFNQTINADMVRREVIDGANCIVIRSATLPDNVVMNGGLYPAEEIANSFASLERVLAPVGHPKKDGKFISATDPYAVHNFDVGAYVANVERKNGKVYHDTVINIDVANQTKRGKDLIKAIGNMEKTGEPIHTSTGILLEREPMDTPATNSQGQEYSWIARNMAFDHNAILLNEQGAATPAQGVGMMVNAEMIDLDTFASDEETSIQQRMEMLTDALKDHIAMTDGGEWCYIADIYPESGMFVYEVGFEGGADEYRKRSFTIDESGEVFIGSDYEVVQPKRIWKANKLLETFMQNMKFAPSMRAAYNEDSSNESLPNEDNEMTLEEMQAALAPITAKIDSIAANQEALASSVTELQANAKAEADAKEAAEKAERETLEANAKAKGWADATIAGMTTNALKDVLGKTEKPAADRTVGGDIHANEKDDWDGYDLNAHLEAK